MEIRLAVEQDLPQLLELYLYLHESQVPAVDDRIRQVWREMLADPKLYLIVGEEGGTTPVLLYTDHHSQSHPGTASLRTGGKCSHPRRLAGQRLCHPGSGLCQGGGCGAQLLQAHAHDRQQAGEHPPLL